MGKQVNQRSLRPVGTVGLHSGGNQPFAADQAIAATQAEVFPYDRNLFRTESGLTQSLDKLNDLWQTLRSSQAQPDGQIVRAREAAAMVATARWMYNSGLRRQETRGMHKRLDYPQQDPNQHHYLISGGLDQVWVKPEPVEAAKPVEKELALR